MADESVIFEVQVEKKVLEQVFNENQHLKENYNDLIKTETLKTNVKVLKNEVQNLQKVIEDLRNENAALRAESLSHASTQNVTNLTEELKRTKAAFDQAQAENYKLDIDKLNLELQIKNLTRKLRLEEERNKSNDLAHVECKVLKLKLHSIETEKEHLQQDFEKERRIITKQTKPRVAKLEENIHHLRKWIEKESKERRPRDSEEVKLLKEHIRTLENDKRDLIEGFELERTVFRKILKTENLF